MGTTRNLLKSWSFWSLGPVQYSTLFFMSMDQRWTKGPKFLPFPRAINVKNIGDALYLIILLFYLVLLFLFFIVKIVKGVLDPEVYYSVLVVLGPEFPVAPIIHLVRWYIVYFAVGAGEIREVSYLARELLVGLPVFIE